MKKKKVVLKKDVLVNNELPEEVVVVDDREEIGLDIPNSPYFKDGLKHFPINFKELLSMGKGYSVKGKFAFRELSVGDMEMLVRMTESDNESKVIIDVLDEMLIGINADALYPSDARFLIGYIRQLSLTEPEYYMNYTCQCGVTNPFAFNMSEMKSKIATGDAPFLTEVSFDDKTSVTIGHPTICRDREAEDFLNKLNEGVSEPSSIVKNLANARMSSYILSMKAEDGELVELSVEDAYTYRKKLPIRKMVLITEAVSGLAEFGFSDQTERQCRSCKEKTIVSLPLDLIFFFPTDND